MQRLIRLYLSSHGHEKKNLNRKTVIPSRLYGKGSQILSDDHVGHLESIVPLVDMFLHISEPVYKSLNTLHLRLIHHHGLCPQVLLLLPHTAQVELLHRGEEREGVGDVYLYSCHLFDRQ